MKAILQKVPVFTDSSFAVQEFSSAHFTAPWHFHPEFELVLVTQGTGKRFVGITSAIFARAILYCWALTSRTGTVATPPITNRIQD